jgi:rSAM/selenodomain-associated transferase 1
MSEADPRRVLGVFAKRPIPGVVKTRLAAQTTPEFAARVAEAFLFDTLHRFAAVSACRVVAFAPPEARSYFDEVARGLYATEPQSEGDLGARMAHFFRTQFGSAERVVLVGTDSPTLPVGFIEDAFERLTKADLVLGPATDGGYYLIGCRHYAPEAIFRGLPWGSPAVLTETIRNLPEDCRMEVLPPWYDVDTKQDLVMMSGHLTALSRAGIYIGLNKITELLEC